MIGFIQMRKDTGDLACIRADEIAAYSENTTKVKSGGGSVSVPCLTVLLRNNVAWHFPYVTPGDLLAAMRSVTGAQVQVHSDLLELFDGDPAEA